ncbi:MAG: TolC family protein [Ignavibacteriales bacterium]
MNGIIFLVFLSLVGADQTLNLSLQDAIRIALENNRDIQIQKENVKIARGNILTQEGIFDPLLNLNSSYEDAKIPTTSSLIPNGAIETKQFLLGSNVTGTLPTGTFYNIFNFLLTRTTTNSPLDSLSPNLSTSLSFSVGQNLLRNFGYGVNETPIIIAKTSSEISVKELERTISDTLLNVETAYWNLVGAKMNLEVTRAELEVSKDLQRRNEIQVEVGTLPSLAVTQAKSEVARDEVNVILAENSLKADEDNLKNILAIPLTQNIVLTDEPITVIKSFDENEAFKEALEKRPEMTEAKLNIENNETEKRFASNQRLPNLSIQGIVTLQGLGGSENPNRIIFGGTPAPIPDQFTSSLNSFSQLFAADFPVWEVLGVFSFPIFNRTARGNYIQASAAVDRSVITLKQTEESVELDVSNAFRLLESSTRGIDAAKTSVELAEEVLRDNQEKLKVGVGTTREVLDAQRDLVTARTEYILAIVSYNIALAQVEHAKGTILEARNVKIKE